MRNKKFFSDKLLKWNNTENTRTMPWKGEKDPYKIWISEIILQQTRVQHGLGYYNRFIKAFPNVHSLAFSPQDKVFKLWEGLGYYSRCKNIIASAKYISEELKGEFPKEFNKILLLKGVGSYTASAIASFAYDLPYAVIDGNVFRVLSRFFGIKVPIDSIEGKRHYSTLANELLDKKTPGIYNQAIMDFGAVICKPQIPLCEICPLRINCVAYIKGMVSVLPIKEKSIIRRKRWMYFLVIENNKKNYVRKRTQKDIWQNLYEFVLIETPAPLTISTLQKQEFFKNIFGSAKFKITKISKPYTQQLTHQTITGQFIEIDSSPLILKDYRLVTQKTLTTLPFPKFPAQYLKDKNVSLNLLS
jgi:A/G-specific adenine glycosylase